MNKHLRALFVVFGITLLVVGVFYIFTRNNAPQENSSEVPFISIDQAMPDFNAKTINGQSIALSQFRGRLVIVNFWASWCGPCVEEMPSLIKLMKSLSKDIELVAISGDSNIEDVNSFIKSFPELKTLSNIHVIFDQDKALSQQYKVFRLPESFVVGRDQKLQKKISGTIDWHSEDALAYLKKLASAQN